MAAPVVALRPAEPADAPGLRALAAHPDIAPFLAVNAADELSQARVVDAEEGIAGAARLIVVNRRSGIGAVRSLMVAPAHRGRGLGAAILHALCEHAFGELGLHRVEAEVYGFNTPALAAFERAGFRREGVRRRAYDRRGAWQDGIHLGRLVDDPPPQGASR